MKNKFASTDVVAAVSGLKRCIGMRVNNIYDIDNKTYLIKLNRQEEKSTLLFESGIRLHLTKFDWPKNPAPSSFTMKLRKHLKNKRLENVNQVGVDRVVDLQFGTGEAAYHVIVELYDRGNVILTDLNYINLSVLRPRKEGDDLRFAVREIYPIDRISSKTSAGLGSIEELKRILDQLKDGENLKRALNPHVEYGSALIEHVLVEAGFPANACIGKGYSKSDDADRLFVALKNAENLLQQLRHEDSKGFIIQREEKRATAENGPLLTFESFEPYLWCHVKNSPRLDRDSFHDAVDEFFSKVESQKLDLKVIQQEKGALKKLDNIKKDHENRIRTLQAQAEDDKVKASLIEMNVDVVERAILAIRSELALQKSWKDISDIVKLSAAQGDTVAKLIKGLKLETNQITMLLSNPYADADDDDEKPLKVDIDIGISAPANARKYYDMKRTATKKEKKTVEASVKAFKSAEKKTKQMLREVATTSTIQKARHVFWFEKFFWCITSDGYLIVGGRDQQQNELVVKRHLKQGDIYFHADVHGASSIVVKNPSGQPLPPRTIQEAALMSVCYSIAWEAKFIASSWWVYWHQVSKTAPAGEYLTTGSFMIRGKKNFVPPSPLVIGFGIMFRLEDSCIERHRQDWKIQKEEQTDSKNTQVEADEEVALSESEDEEKEKSTFPDTVVRLNESEVVHQIKGEDNNDDQVTIIGQLLNEPKKSAVEIKTASQKPPQSSKKLEEGNLNKQGPSKRGQHGKIKKMKEKYRDQDEDERALRMQLLQSSGAQKEKKKKDAKKKKQEQIQSKSQPFSKQVTVGLAEIKEDIETQREELLQKTEVNITNEKMENREMKNTLEMPDQVVVSEEKGSKPEKSVVKPDTDDEEEGEEKAKSESDDVFKLTGQPSEEDELLFAVPIVTAYSALSNFKYKVKVIPGTSKRGKAAKAALQMFTMDKTASQREKDLLKSLKDQDVARNLPGKVKILAQNLNRMKK